MVTETPQQRAAREDMEAIMEEMPPRNDPVWSDAYDWHTAPVCDAFAPSKYPPPVAVNPDHVGYAVQRYVSTSSLGERVVGYFMREEAEALVKRLNGGDRSGVRIVNAHL